MKHESIFPNIEVEHKDAGYTQESPFDGLTKRELFAAMAMQGLLTNPTAWGNGEGGMPGVDAGSLKDLGNHCTEYADALIKQLNEGAPND